MLFRIDLNNERQNHNIRNDGFSTRVVAKDVCACTGMHIQKVLQEIQEKRQTLQELSKNLMIQTVSNQHLVFEVAGIRFYQCDANEAFLIDFYQDQLSFKLCELIRFRNKINQIDIAALLSGSGSETELIYLPESDRFLLLSIQNILVLKELLQGSFVMMELNSMIQRSYRLSWI